MKINKKTDLAIRILKYLDQADNNNYLSGNLIARDLDISYHHLRRIIPLLTQLGYTSSKQGKDGGIKLSAESYKIPISKLLLQTELTNTCINDCETCVLKVNCHFEQHTQQAIELFCTYFEQVFIKDL